MKRFELLPGERAGEGLRRIALAQLDEAIELLEAAGESVPATVAVHDTRKALKRVRALLRLVRKDLGESGFAREDVLLRDASMRLAGAREAQALLTTLDDLLKRHPRKLGGRAVVVALRDQLLDERERAAVELLGDGPARAEVLRQLRGSRSRVADWRLPDRPGIATMEAGLRDIYREGRRSRRRVARDHGGSLPARHRWRKRVKHLRYGAEVLGVAGPARGADELAELLGQERDLALLAQRVRGMGAQGEEDRARLLKLIARRRRKLRRRALARGRRLYRRGPAKFIKRARDEYASRAA